MSTTTATNNSTNQQRLQQRELERQQRGLQFQSNNSTLPFFPIANVNVHFSEPVKYEHEDETAKRIKHTLGNLLIFL